MEEIKCPDCNSDVVYYHTSPGITRTVCEKKCKGWKVITEIHRFPEAE